MKKLLDVIASTGGLIILSPLFLISAVLIKMTSRGPVFFRQERVGRDGELFLVYKFRTMYEKGDSRFHGNDNRGDNVVEKMDSDIPKRSRELGIGTRDINKGTRENDKGEEEFEAGDRSRVTPIGRILRMTKVDEIPQLINVLKGDMSIVGPRPEVKKWTEVYPEKWKIVHRVKPGITDNASIEFRNEEEILSRVEEPERIYKEVILPKKLEMYIEYVNDHSLYKDAGIVLRTVGAIFYHKGSKL